MSCDNLPSNGRRLAGLVTAVADPADLEGVTFPGTMVDRIVPASTAETYALAEQALGVRDLAAVSAEPYRQWVIEDAFPAGRPAWEKAGAVLTGDAKPWERLKLRTLNGVHSAVAYLGALAGEETIAGAVELPGMRAVMGRFVAEDVAPGLTPPDGVDVVAYGAECIERFANPTLGHRTVQVAMDGSQKLPQRVLETVAARRAAGAMPHWAALIVAAWIRFAQGTADDGRALPLDDPLASLIKARVAGSDPVDDVFGLEAVFPPELAADDALKEDVRGWLTALTRHGVKDTLATA
jgi:fructuronate reductase